MKIVHVYGRVDVGSIVRQKKKDVASNTHADWQEEMIRSCAQRSKALEEALNKLSPRQMSLHFFAVQGCFFNTAPFSSGLDAAIS